MLPPYAPNLGARLVAIVDRWYQNLPSLRPYQRARRIRNLYYGLPSETSPFDVTSVAMMGEQGELTGIQVNRLHHLGQRLLTMVGTDDFSWQPVAANGDTVSREEAILAGSVLEHEKRASRLQAIRHSFDELAITDGSAFFAVTWDPKAGDKYEEMDGQSYYEGRLRVRTYEWWRCPVDLNRQDADHDWVITTAFVNRWDLAARYAQGNPALYSRLASLPPENRYILRWQEQVRGRFWDPETDSQVPLYTLYHKPTPSVPEGREVVFVSDGTVLWDGPSVYGEQLPVYRVASANIIGTVFGNSPLSDVVSLQSVVNMMYSTQATNAVNHGIANVFMSTNANLSRSQFDGANIWEMDNPESVQVIDLLKTSPEVMNLAKDLMGEMTTLLGFNSVSLGMQEHQMSGKLAALLDSKSMQYASLFISGDRQGVESLGTAIIDRYRRFAKAPRVLEVIAGEGRRYMLKDFTGQKLGSIARVTVEARNGAMSTVAGKMAFAEFLVESGVLSDPNPLPLRILTSVYTQGNLDVATMPVETEDMLIARENDMLTRGEVPPVHSTDNHLEHIRRHRDPLANPDARMNPAIAQATDAHLLEHINVLRTLDADLLRLMGQEPLGLVPGAPIPPPGNQPQPMLPEGVPPGGPLPEEGMAAMMGPPPQDLPVPAEVPPMPMQ